METRLLILNAEPVFQDQALTIFDAMEKLERRIVRTLGEAIAILLRESFDLFVVEGEAAVAIEEATNARQHFPSLEIVCLLEDAAGAATRAQAEEQRIALVPRDVPTRQLRRSLRKMLSAFERFTGSVAEGIDSCHSLIGSLDQFSAAEILQMCCLSQRTGRFVFKSARGDSEVYLNHGTIRHAVYGTLEGEAALAETFRWRQGRFYFEEGIINRVQTIDRPLAHLLLDNLQKSDELIESAGLTKES
jgi:hypothetical protein